MKMSNNKRWAVLTGLLLTLPSMSYAADTGIYAGVGLGYAVLDEQAPNEDKSDIGSKIYAGMRIMGPLGVEAAYYNLGKYNNEQEKVTGTSISVVGNFDIKSVSLFAKAGVFNWKVEDAAAGTTLSDADTAFGIGLNIPVEKRLLIRMEWERFAKIGKDATNSAPGQDMSLLSFGVNYMF